MLKRSIDAMTSLDYTSDNITKTDVLHATTTGWHALIHEFFYAVSKFSNVRITRMYGRWGAIYFELDAEHALDQSILDRLVQSIARDSTHTCVICGQRGQRRKLEIGWPCLCHEHYIEYVNDEEYPAEDLIAEMVEAKRSSTASNHPRQRGTI